MICGRWVLGGLCRRPQLTRACAALCLPDGRLCVSRTRTPQRRCSTTTAAPITTATGVPTSSTSSSRTRLACPECGKRFICAANLRHHRLQRHSVRVASPEEEMAQHTEVERRHQQHRLEELQARIVALKERPRRSKVVAEDDGQHFPVAAVRSRAMVVEEEQMDKWRSSTCSVGTGTSTWIGIGVVRGPIAVGHLHGHLQAAGLSPTTSSPQTTTTTSSFCCDDVPHDVVPRYLQFSLETHGYREGRPGQMRLFRNVVLVRLCVAHNTPARVAEGDVVRVLGNYTLHMSYDVVSKRLVENPVVEAEDVAAIAQPA